MSSILQFKKQNREFPGGPVVKTLHFHCKGHRFDPWLGNKNPKCHQVRPKNMYVYSTLKKIPCTLKTPVLDFSPLLSKKELKIDLLHQSEWTFFTLKPKCKLNWIKNKQFTEVPQRALAVQFHDPSSHTLPKSGLGQSLPLSYTFWREILPF